MKKTKRGIRLSTNLLDCLYRELISEFSKHHNLDIKTLKVFQLYGFGQYNEAEANVRQFIYERTNESVNGKYLYTKIKLLESSPAKTIHITRDYLAILIKAVGYRSYKDFIDTSDFVSDEMRREEENQIDNSIDYDNTLYYVGYYVEDKNYFIKSKLTIYQGRTVDWDISYLESDGQPSFYSYTGKIVMNGESAMSFYFPKENSNIKKECFINIFSGNNMRVKPLLIGSYCGFERSNNPVIGKIILERMNSQEEQIKTVLSREINPIFYQQLYSKRISIEGVLPHELNELLPSVNYEDIIKYLIGDYFGFFIDKSQNYVPVVFKVLDRSARVEFYINNKKYVGIGRISTYENYLNVEFENEQDNHNCNFSLQVKPVGDKVFSSHILVNVGTLIFSGQAFLWKDGDNIQDVIERNPKFSINQFELSDQLKVKLNEFINLTSNNNTLYDNQKTYEIPKSLKGMYFIEADNNGNKEKWELTLDSIFEISTVNYSMHGRALYMHGNICLLQLAKNDIDIIGLALVFIGNTSRKQILKKKGIFLSYDPDNKPITINISINSTD